MSGLFEMSLLIGLVLMPALLAWKAPASLFRRVLTLGVVYYACALFVIPRLPG